MLFLFLDYEDDDLYQCQYQSIFSSQRHPNFDNLGANSKWSLLCNKTPRQYWSLLQNVLF
jgi:hypothetical protein